MSSSIKPLSKGCQPQRTMPKARGGAILWEQRSFLTASISAYSPVERPAWSCCLARRKTRATGLGRFFAQPGNQRGGPKREAVVSPDPERLLRATRVRAAARGRPRRGLMAPMDRHYPRFAARHRRMADRTPGCGRHLSGRPPLSGRAFHSRGRWGGLVAPPSWRPTEPAGSRRYTLPD